MLPKPNTLQGLHDSTSGLLFHRIVSAAGLHVGADGMGRDGILGRSWGTVYTIQRCLSPMSSCDEYPYKVLLESAESKTKRSDEA